MKTLSSGELNAFRSFEHLGWQSVAEQYHDSFAGLTPQAIGPLLDSVGAKQGVRLLDAATGPGYVAGEAARRQARVIGMDFSAAMVAQARRKNPQVPFGVGDAEQLPFRNGSFDVAVMNFGLLHLARPEDALREMYRVIRSGGRVGFTVWTTPEEAVGFGIVLRTIETYGRLDVALPPGPPFFRFSDPTECRRALLDAGFVNPEIKKVPQVWQLPSPDALFQAMESGTVRTGGLLRAQSAELQDAIRRAIREAAAAYETQGVVQLPMPAILAAAQKP